MTTGLHHLLGIADMSKGQFLALLHNARELVEVSERALKKVPALRGRTVINFFLEASTRTRTSFELAAKRLSADAINLTGSSSSVTKGESLRDTARTLAAMAPDVVVIRHHEAGAAHLLARELRGCAVVNAGDGMHEHPTQALLDCLTLWEVFDERLTGDLTVAIVGDIRHSRVARSNIIAHRLLGNRVRLVGPPTLVPSQFADELEFGSHCSVHHSAEEGFADVDAVMCLRMQLERAAGGYVPTLEEYAREYCLTPERLEVAKPDCRVLHPGPLNRGIEISEAVAESNRALVERQVTHGVAVRMATLLALATRPGRSEIDA